MDAFSRQPIWPMFHSTLHVCGKAYDQTPHNDRFCPVCNSGIIEGNKGKILQSNPTQFCRF